jgi:hypothetical protein
MSIVLTDIPSHLSRTEAKLFGYLLQHQTMMFPYFMKFPPDEWESWTANVCGILSSDTSTVIQESKLFYLTRRLILIGVKFQEESGPTNTYSLYVCSRQKYSAVSLTRTIYSQLQRQPLIRNVASRFLSFPTGQRIVVRCQALLERTSLPSFVSAIIISIVQVQLQVYQSTNEVRLEKDRPVIT